MPSRDAITLHEAQLEIELLKTNDRVRVLEEVIQSQSDAIKESTAASKVTTSETVNSARPKTNDRGGARMDVRESKW